jgi:putative NIF3 family GTP cyclohydrolase 1 type 2
MTAIVAQQQQRVTQVAVLVVALDAVQTVIQDAITAVTHHAALIHAQPVYVTQAVKVAATALPFLLNVQHMITRLFSMA